MAENKWIKCTRRARLAAGDDPIQVHYWDEEWDAFGAFPLVGTKLTPQNVRGAIRRNMQAEGYEVDILEKEITCGASNLRTGATFRFRRMLAEKLPKQKPVRKPPEVELPAPILIPEPVDTGPLRQLILWLD